MSGFHTIEDVRKANAALGHHWFEPAAMRFFRTRICGRLIGGRYFVTSEKGPDGVRAYSVREVQPDGAVSTVGEFQAYATRRQAIARAKHLARHGGEAA